LPPFRPKPRPKRPTTKANGRRRALGQKDAHAPVTLAQIKAEKKLAGFGLVKKSRLSVVPASAGDFELILELSGTKP
jgi:predicted RNA-binding protein with PUA-like domain